MKPCNYLTYWISELGVQKGDYKSRNNIIRMLGYEKQVSRYIPNDFPTRGENSEKPTDNRKGD